MDAPPNPDNATSAAKSPRRLSLREKFGIGFLVLLATTWASSAIHVYALEREFNVELEKKVQGHRQDIISREDVGHQIASTMTISKAYYVFGAVTAKAHVYIKKDNNPFIESYEYYFKREGNQWTETDSGYCASEYCTVQGNELLGIAKLE